MNGNQCLLGDLIQPAPPRRAGNAVYPILSMTMHGGLVDQAEKFKKRVASADTAPYKLVGRGQLVVGFPIDEGVLSFQNLYDEAIVSPAYDVWNVKMADRVDRSYLERFLRAPRALKYYRTKLRSTTARRRTIPDDVFLSLPVHLPSRSEQRRIAAILDQADALRTQRRHALSKLDTISQSLFLSLLTKTETSPKQSLNSLCSEINDCPHSTPVWTDSGKICLRTANLGLGEWDWTDERFVSEETYVVRSGRGHLGEGDIVLSREGTVGVAAIVPVGMKACMGQRLVQLRPHLSRVTSEYLLAYLVRVLDH